MKKKFMPILLAVVLVASQLVPMTVNANTWVEDSGTPGGGYWMDNEGYIIEEEMGAPAGEVNQPEEEQGVAPYEAEPRETSVAEATIVAITSDNPSYQKFSILANCELEFVFYLDGHPASPSFSYSEGILQIADNKNYYNVAVLEKKTGNFLAQASTVLEHSYTITYDFAGIKEVVESGIVVAGEEATHTAAVYKVGPDGNEYELEGGVANATQNIKFGKSDYTFKYKLYNPKELTATVTYTDEKGNILGKETQAVTYKETTTFEIPDQYEKDGRTYKKVDSTSKIILDYFSPQLDYSIMYRAEDSENKDPYSVKLQYVSADGGAVLGEDYFTVTEEHIAQKAEVEFHAPAEIVAYEGDKEVYYQAVNSEDLVITHNASDYKKLTYTVKYEKIDENAPYTWSVRLIDAGTGDVLKTIDHTVAVNKDAVYAVDSEITVNDANYVLDAGMAKEYRHNYGDSGRIQYIYYNAESDVVLTSYNLKVQYKNVTDNAFLYSTEQKVTAQELNSAIPTPADYTGKDGTEYIKLQGQEDVTHNFFSPQRTYTIYYRDANDVQNADTVVTQEQVIRTEQVVEVPVVVDDATVVPGEVATDETPVATPIAATETPNTVLNNEETNTVTTLTDEGVPLADLAAEELKDEKVPLANKGLAENGFGVTQLMIVFTGILLLAAVAFVIAKRRKNKVD